MMKKLFLLLSTAFLMVAPVSAQPLQQRVESLHCNPVLPVDAGGVTKHSPESRQLLSPVAAGPNRLISDQPAGTHYYYSRSGDAYLYFFALYLNKLSGSVSEMVFGNDGKVYLKNLITQYNLVAAEKIDSWVEGTIVDGTITFQLPQPVMTVQGNTYYATLMTLSEDQNTFVKQADQLLVLDYDAETGQLSTPPGSPFATGQQVVGLTDLSGSWTGYADWNIDLRRVEDQPVVAPADLSTSEYTIAAEGFDGALGRVGFADNEIYVQGLYPSLPDTWAKGTIIGDKAVFASGQFLGADTTNDRFVYLFAATSSTVKNENGEEVVSYTLSNDDIVFNYDATTKSLTEGTLFVANNGKWDSTPVVTYANARICPFKEVAATPVSPRNLTIFEGGFSDYNNGYGWGHLEFNLPNADSLGNYLVPEKLSYALFTRVNGEERQLRLYSSDYQHQTEPVLDEVPYTYGDDWDVYVRGNVRSIYYFVVGPEAYGVQAIYRGGGEERRSAISWVGVSTLGASIQPDAATPSYPAVDSTDVGSEILFTPITSGETRGYYGDWKAKTYDVAMKVQDAAVTGSYIEEITFPLMRVQNISNVKIWLSSQLRVENNENVPDLASFDVEANRAGSITVKLDKPYVIPAEGVYVGYSFTVDENTYKGTNGPLRVVNKAKPSGFYIHSTNSILKWMDISSEVDKSTMMELKLGGSKVKVNAVSPVDGESLFVHAGEEIKLPVYFVNHGSAGIVSLDLDFVLNGETTQQHIDLRNKVTGTFGLNSRQVLTLPAIANRGTYDLTLRVVKVNNQANEDADIESSHRFIVINGEPKHRPLLEEYTGTWCGWCPRGFVALEKLSELYPDDYVCVAYHNGDPMEITKQLPVTSFPNAILDRGMQLDPYYGSSYGNGNQNFGILDDLKWRASQFGVADIDVAAKLSADEKSVDVTTNVLFPFNNDHANYSLEYLLVANGLTGEGSQWDQANNFSGQNYGPDMVEFQRSGNPASGLVYNDVVVMLSQVGGIDGSIPDKVTADMPVTHTYTFDLNQALNTNGAPVIQDVNKLQVVALLISHDEENIVANANKTIVSTPVSVGTIVDRGKQTVDTQCFDLSGRQLQQLQPGMNIIRYHYADGTTRTVKVVR
ncbi:MAG: hypothetical protein K5683_06280 [Prevotella sp.]|nr:hypothetical protein [Prevotella sp.]